MLPSPSVSLPLMQALAQCHASFISQGLPFAARLSSRKTLIPATATGFWDLYGGAAPAPGLQRSLVGFIEKLTLCPIVEARYSTRRSSCPITELFSQECRHLAD